VSGAVEGVDCDAPCDDVFVADTDRDIARRHSRPTADMRRTRE